MKFSFPWKRQNRLFLHMHLQTTSLLKGLPREKLEVTPFHVLEKHCPLCLRPDSPLDKSELQAKQTNGQRDVLNLNQETMKSLPVCLDLYMFQCVSFFFL